MPAAWPATPMPSPTSDGVPVGWQLGLLPRRPCLGAVALATLRVRAPARGSLSAMAASMAASELDTESNYSPCCSPIEDAALAALLDSLAMADGGPTLSESESGPGLGHVCAAPSDTLVDTVTPVPCVLDIRADSSSRGGSGSQSGTGARALGAGSGGLVTVVGSRSAVTAAQSASARRRSVGDPSLGPSTVLLAPCSGSTAHPVYSQLEGIDSGPEAGTRTSGSPRRSTATATRGSVPVWKWRAPLGGGRGPPSQTVARPEQRQAASLSEVDDTQTGCKGPGRRSVTAQPSSGDAGRLHWHLAASVPAHVIVVSQADRGIGPRLKKDCPCPGGLGA